VYAVSFIGLKASAFYAGDRLQVFSRIGAAKNPAFLGRGFGLAKN
jgi:hypothetical protein